MPEFEYEDESQDADADIGDIEDEGPRLNSSLIFRGNPKMEIQK
ncbi:MAG: hypothetical protein ABEJ65_05210 [bacterium]